MRLLELLCDRWDVDTVDRRDRHAWRLEIAPVETEVAGGADRGEDRGAGDGMAAGGRRQSGAPRGQDRAQQLAWNGGQVERLAEDESRLGGKGAPGKDP